jgi:outer membrane protein insertion porin family
MPGRRASGFGPALSVGVVLLCLVSTALAQSSLDRLVGQRVADVKLRIDGQATTEPDLVRVLETQAGTAFSPQGVRESIVHLMALGRFEDVRVSAEAVEPGVALTFDLVSLKSVKGVELRGDVGLPPRQLRNEVLNRYGSSPPASRSDEIARVLEAYYHERGFLGASVKPTIETRPDSRFSTLFLDVSAGSRVTVATYDVQGAPDGIGSAVAQRLGLAPGAPFDPTALRERTASYLDDLRSKGFIEAKLDVEPGYSGDRRSVDVAVRMNRGPHFTVAFSGDALPESRKDELSAIQREGTIDEDMLENEQLSLENELRAEGYRDAQVRYDREVRSPDEVQVVFKIRRGPQYRVARVDVSGNEHLPLAALQPLIRLVPGQWFVESRLNADADTIAERYRRDGFASVKVEPRVAPGRVVATLDVVLAVTEGPRTRVESVDFSGNASLPEGTLRGQARTIRGGAYYGPEITADRDAILVAYLSRGYQLASVDAQTKFTTDQSGAAVRFVISEGPQIRIDHVLVVGNVRTKVAMIERESSLRRGQELSLLRLADAQSRLNALGLFRRVQVVELQRGSETNRDVLITVEEAAPNTIGYGGGLEAYTRPKTDPDTGVTDRVFDVVPRGFVEYGRRNFWGKNRSINFFARAAVRSSSLNDESANPDQNFREYRLLAAYREPRVLGWGVDLGATALAEQASRTSFDFERRQAVAEATHRFSPTVTVGGRYTLGQTRLFNQQYTDTEKLLIDRVYGESGVRVGSISGSITRNTRDDAAEPTRGALLFFDATLASTKFGSEVGFLRGLVQGFTYRSLPKMRNSVLALGARLGLATGFSEIPKLDGSGQPVVGPDGQPVYLRQLPASERFFAGGDNTVRGFDQDQLGAAGVLDENGVSSGGGALLIVNAELRFPVLSRIGLGGAAFVDVGNVYEKVESVDLAQLRTSLGLGIRWRSPVGPLRIDFGWKATQHTFPNGERERRFAPHIQIGQAF